jgi:endo-1,4-beta-D-glucanase Y
MVNERSRWIESSDVIPMFPSLLWKLQIAAGLRDAMDAKILAALAEMRRGQRWNEGRTAALRRAASMSASGRGCVRTGLSFLVFRGRRAIPDDEPVSSTVASVSRYSI